MWTPDPSVIVTAAQRAEAEAAAMLAGYTAAVQAHLDQTARSRGYDGALAIATYLGSSIPQWAAEAQAFIAWRDAVWAYGLTELAKVKSGERERPELADFVGELPAMEWPA